MTPANDPLRIALLGLVVQVETVLASAPENDRRASSPGLRAALAVANEALRETEPEGGQQA